MEIIINNNLFNVKCVLTQKDTKNGMMGKKFDDEYDGMLFIMNDGSKSFWMKNCKIPLNIIFIEDNKIQTIQHNCQPCNTDDCPHYKGFGSLVLEIEGGSCKRYDIKEGDRVYFN